MGSGEIWPVILCIGLAVAMAATPLLSRADPPEARPIRRISSLDGLRGFLALAVLMHHGAIYAPYLQTGRWVLGSDFTTMLGQGGVSLFFMITGYLFWRRLVTTGGRIDLFALYIGRIFRIGPVYAVAAGCAVLGTMLLTRQLNVPLSRVSIEVAAWIPLGAAPAGWVNGYDTRLLLAGVTWSLQYEWLFYAALPLLALVARFPRAHLPSAAILFVSCLAWLVVHPASSRIGSLPAFAALFATGMLAGSLQLHGWVPKTMGRLWSALAVLLLLTAVFGFATAYDPGAILCLSAFFYLIVSGCSLFGALQTRAARRLGNISYDIYLLQGLVLAALMRPALMRSVVLGSSVGHWSMVALACSIVLLVSTAVHVWIEQPGIRLGALVTRWLSIRPASIALGPAFGTDHARPVPVRLPSKRER